MFGVLNPWLLLGAVFLILAAFGGGYLKGSADASSQHLREELLIHKASQAAQEAAAEQIAQIKIKHTTIQKAVHREVREKTVYRDCRHDDSGVRLINAALANRPDSPPDRKLPRITGRSE
jgi:hypothetical protein